MLGVTASNLLLLGPLPPLDVLAMVVCVAAGSYGIDRIVDRARAGKTRRAWVASAGAAVCLALGFGMALPRAGLLLASVTWLFPLAVAAYCMPWLGVVPALRRRGIRRVKDVPYTKNLYTAGCLALCVTWAAALSGASGLALGAVFSITLLGVIVNVVACDLGDVEDDRRDGVPTFAVRFGRAATARGLRWAIRAWVGLLVLGAAIGLFAAPTALLVALAASSRHAIVARLDRDEVEPLYADVVPDLAELVPAGLALFGHFAFGA